MSVSSVFSRPRLSLPVSPANNKKKKWNSLTCGAAGSGGCCPQREAPRVWRAVVLGDAVASRNETGRPCVAPRRAPRSDPVLRVLRQGEGIVRGETEPGGVRENCSPLATTPFGVSSDFLWAFTRTPATTSARERERERESSLGGFERSRRGETKRTCRRMGWFLFGHF